MYSKNFFCLIFLSTLVFAQQKEIIAYFPQWGVEHQPYYIKHVELAGSADKITIINYAFAIPQPDSAGNIIAGFMNDFYDYRQIYSKEMSVDGIADKNDQKLRGHFNQLKKLKARHPHLKIVLSIGGWLGSVYFSDAALSQSSREIFVNSCINRFIKGNLPVKDNAGGMGVASGIFDGFDIDWEFPVKGGIPGIHHNKNDNNNLTKLYALFRKKLDAIDPALLLTAAVPAKDNPAQLYNIKKDSQYLNWYLLMTYDYYGGWDKQTGHLANLLTNTQSGVPFSMDAAVKMFHQDYGVPLNKLIPGVAFYGRSWKNVESKKNGFNQSGVNGPGKYEAGFDYYADIMPLKKEGFHVYWDDLAMAETMYNPIKKIFWTYDEPQSAALKARYVDAYNLRGIMFWEISGDDPAGTLVNTLFTRNMPESPYDRPTDKNRMPEITIQYPGEGDTFKVGSNVIIKTNPNDKGGPIAKVEFFIDNTSIGFDSTPPFRWVWFNASKGKHEIKCIATDKRGAVSLPQRINIFIKGY